MIEGRKLLLYIIAAAALHAVIAIVTNSHRIFFGGFGPHAVAGHIEIFYDYASKAVQGQVPYRDYLIEYPILGFVVFLIPRLIVSDFPGYRIAFGAELLLFNAAAVYLVALKVERDEGIGRVPGRLGWYTLFFASLCPLLMGPYDLVPMAVGFAAASWWFSGRNGLGGMAAGLGVLLKIFPGAVAGPALVWDVSRPGRPRVRGMLAFLGTLAVGATGWFALGGRRVLDSFRYHAERGLEIESLYAGILLLIGKVSGTKVAWDYNHHAFHLASRWGSRVAPLVLPIQMMAILLVIWQYRRSGMIDGVRYAGAAVLAFIITGKVLSPQFMIWLFPYMAVIGGEAGRRARWLFLLACLASTVIYPWGALLSILDEDLGGILLLNLRNAILLGLLFVLLFGDKAGEPRPGPAG